MLRVALAKKTQLQTRLLQLLQLQLFLPGDQELAAVQVQHKDATASQLKEGYELYSKTACVSCHEAKNIYKRPLERWKDIVDDMAQRAKITETQKDAVYKYVLSIKTTQPK